MQSRGTRGESWILFAILGLMLSSACASTTYGSRRYEVAFETTPAGADLYLVRYTTWELSEGPGLLRDYQDADSAGTARAARVMLEGFLAPYRVDEGVTPLSLEVIAYEHIVFGMKGDQFARTRFLPRPRGNSDQKLLLRTHSALTGS